MGFIIHRSAFSTLGTSGIFGNFCLILFNDEHAKRAISSNLCASSTARGKWFSGETKSST
jgi:hypothetical protein